MKAVFYARVSSESQEKQATIESQVQQLKDYAARKGYELVGSYQDDGYSGDLLARPDLDRLRDDAAKGLFECVLISDPDRLARKFIYQELVIDDLKKHGVTVEFKDGNRGETAEDKLTTGIRGVVAEYEKAKIAERLRRGKLHKLRNGVMLGGMGPYGYRYIPKQGLQPGRYEIIESEAKVVRLIFDLVGNRGLSLMKTHAELVRRGIPSRGRRGNRAWSRSSLVKVLRNETVMGVAHWYKHQACESSSVLPYRRSLRTSHKIRERSEWIPVSVPAIIDADLFHRARRQIEANTVFSARNSRNEYLLRGLIRCGICGSSLSGEKSHGQFYYRCCQRQRVSPAPRTCTARMVARDYVEPLIWSKLKSVLENPRALMSQLNKAAANVEAKNLSSPRALEILQNEKAHLKVKRDRAVDAHLAGVLDLAMLREQMDILKAQQNDVEARETALKAAQGSQIDLGDLQRRCRIIRNGLDAISKDFDKKQNIVRLLVKSVSVTPESFTIKGAIPSDPVGIAALPYSRYAHNPTPEFTLTIPRVAHA